MQVVGHVLFELTNTFLAERMRHCLAFACMLCSIPRIEEATLDGDEGIVVVAILITGVSSVHV